MNDLVVARRYRLGRRIGTGGMGRVWLAMDEVLRREVAVKEVLLPEGLTDDDAAELRLRTLREARTAGKVSHPNVIKVYDVIYAENRPWIVMEYVESRSLAQVIKEDGPMPPEEAARIGLSILAALVAAHEAGVLHRDVKPGNVLLGPKRVVLTDFGLATFDDIGSALTASGVVHGSPQFIAPERALDGTSTAAADMWSLGATLYAAVEGRAPYARASSYATLTALATAPPDPPKRAGALKPVLHGLLRRNPESRMKPDEVLAWLQQITETGPDGEGSRSRIPKQRGTDPDSSNGSGRTPPTRPAATAPVSHARRNRRPSTPTTLPRTPEPVAPAANGAHAADPGLPVAGSAPPATGPTPPAATASKQAAFVHPRVELERDTDHQMDLAWKLDLNAGGLGADGVSSGRVRGDNEAARRARRRSQVRAARWLAAVVVVMAAAAGGAIGIRHLRQPEGASKITLPPASAPTVNPSPGTAAVVKGVTWPCNPTRPAGHITAVQPPPANPPPVRGINGPIGPLLGYRWVTVDGLHAIVPIGWGTVTKGKITCYYNPGGANVLGYNSWVPTKLTAAAELQAQMAAFATTLRWANYKQQGDIDVGSIGVNDATVTFTYTVEAFGSPLAMEGEIYLVYANPKLAYACFYTTPAAQFASLVGDFGTIQTDLYATNETS
ncbi:MAG TPA: serine/threonine-protein kinase [Micromonosporaceae bacterium]